jgi:predicted DNA-binding transcriptional regulator AlpA
MSLRIIRMDRLATMPEKPPGKVPFSKSTIERWERDGKFPKSFLIGDSRCWDEDEIDAFLEAQKAAQPEPRKVTPRRKKNTEAAAQAGV